MISINSLKLRLSVNHRKNTLERSVTILTEVFRLSHKNDSDISWGVQIDYKGM